MKRQSPLSTVVLSLLVILFFLAFTAFGLSDHQNNYSSGTQLDVQYPPPKEAYNVTEAYTNLYLSYSSYCDLDVPRWNCTYCTTNYTSSFKFVNYFASFNITTFGYVGYMDNAIFVVFRGTQGLKDLIIDLNFAHVTLFPSPLLNCYVHKGFYDSYNTVRNQTVAIVKQAQQQCPTCDRLKITGHSLGGALAVLCAADFSANTLFNLPIQLYNFGQPRVGNEVFVMFYTSLIDTTWRIVNQRDLVPHLPTMFMGFRHEPTEVWYYNSTTNYRICSSATGEDPTCSDSLVDLSVYDHLHYFGIDLDAIVC